MHFESEAQRWTGGHISSMSSALPLRGKGTRGSAVIITARPQERPY